MAVAFQTDFETVQSLAERMIYKEPMQPILEVVEDGELVESDTDIIHQQRRRQMKSPLECGFKQTQAKPAIFFKILTEDEVKAKDRARRERRNRNSGKGMQAVVDKDFDRRHRSIENLKSKERRMREVILSELANLRRNGHNVDRPENVHPAIRGDVGELTEENELRRRLFHGCFREFLYENSSFGESFGAAARSQARKRTYSGEMTHPTSFYARHTYNVATRTQEHSQGRDKQRNYGRYEDGSHRSVLNSVTWTAEEVRLYYECMAKYNVHHVAPPSGTGREFYAATVHASQKVLSGGVSTCLSSTYIEPNTTTAALVQSRKSSVSAEIVTHGTFPSVACESRSPVDTIHPQESRKSQESPRTQEHATPDQKDGREPAKPLPDLPPRQSTDLNVLENINVQPTSVPTSANSSLSATIFVEELLEEPVEVEASCFGNDESGEDDLYDDL